MCRPVRRDGESFDRVPVPRFVDDDADLLWSLTAASRRLDAVATRGFERLLESVAPDVFHVVNNTRLPLDLVEVAKQRGVPVVRTVTGTEDLCGLVTPVSPISIGGVCASPLSPRQCVQCVLAAQPGLATALGLADDRERAVEALLQRKRARVVQHFTDLVDAVVFPSTAFRGELRTLVASPVPARHGRRDGDRPHAVGWRRRGASGARSVRACTARRSRSSRRPRCRWPRARRMSSRPSGRPRSSIATTGGCIWSAVAIRASARRSPRTRTCRSTGPSTPRTSPRSSRGRHRPVDVSGRDVPSRDPRVPPRRPRRVRYSGRWDPRRSSSTV